MLVHDSKNTNILILNNRNYPKKVLLCSIGICLQYDTHTAPNWTGTSGTPVPWKFRGPIWSVLTWPSTCRFCALAGAKGLFNIFALARNWLFALAGGMIFVRTRFAFADTLNLENAQFIRRWRFRFKNICFVLYLLFSPKFANLAKKFDLFIFTSKI